MTATGGIDLMRGRFTPAIGTTEAKLQQRKLDALKRGVHRIGDAAALPYSVHLIGVGGAGVPVVEQFLRDAPADLLSQYSEFMKLEYPLYHANPDSAAWLPGDTATLGQPLPRALAKAAYGRAYYDGDRPMLAALNRFARSLEATGGDSLVCLVFGLGGGTGSGIAPDLARHLSNGLFGRRVLVIGIGIAPHEVDAAERSPAALFPVLAELDVLCDDDKNRGVTLSCGDLYKNPNTASFVIVPQPAGGSAQAVCESVNRELLSFMLQRRGANLWEALRQLNWVVAPSTQHSAARTPWGARRIHLFGFGDGNQPQQNPDWADVLGLLPDHAPEFIELRTADGADSTTSSARAADHQVILMLTDGEPSKIDLVEDDYVVEDARHAVASAAARGIRSFCLTLDRDADRYVRRIFGARNYLIADHADAFAGHTGQTLVRLVAH